jgi:lysophospholipase L1-like esterase
MNLSPLPIQKFFDNNGRPLVGGLLFTYEAGTSTKVATYTSESGLALNTNPIELNFRGECSIWLDSTVSYKFVLAPSGDTDPPTNPIWSVDDISSGITLADLTAQILGQILWPQTAAESLANVVPENYAFEPNFIERQGADNANGDNLDEINNAYLPATQPTLNIQNRFVTSRGGTFAVSDWPTNPYGVDLAEAGSIMLQFIYNSGTYYRQINSYANNQAGPYLIGKEYQYHLYNKLIAGGTGIGIFAYGDSTVAGGNGESSQLLIQNLFPNLGYWAGLPQPLNVTNQAVGGTSWQDFATSGVFADVNGGTADVILIKYGINDGSLTYSTRLDETVSTMRTQLAAIRALGNGTLDNLTIILVGPTSTSDTPNQRDEYWYEQLRGAYVQAARDYQCLYFDSYAYLQDSRHANGWDMDNPYGDTVGEGIAVHPLNERLLWFWPAVFRSMFGWDETRFWGLNNFINLSGNWSAGNTTAATVPSSYGFGISIYRATTGNGFPIDGVLINVRQADGASMQTLFPFADANRTQIPKRLAYITGDSWTQWTGIANAMSLQNSWVAFGSSFDEPKYILGEDNIVTCTGLIKSGTTTAGTTIATLPAGYRPPAIQGPLVVATNAGTCQIKIDTSGNIQFQTAGDATYTNLNFCFRAA